jgi:hypothetical protein
MPNFKMVAGRGGLRVASSQVIAELGPTRVFFDPGCEKARIWCRRKKCKELKINLPATFFEDS